MDTKLSVLFVPFLLGCIHLSVGFKEDVDVPIQEPLEWWQTSVFYHLYPRSFKDSNGDGVGDLKGMVEKLPEHLHDLGVGAVWISPIFKSPMADFGYDISDYLSFEPLFGDLKDFETLKERLHALGIKILLDFETEFKETVWTFAPERNQFYFHHFLREQPDLNYNNPHTREAMKNVLRFWLDQGVDGFRMDAVPFLIEDPQFRDDPVISDPADPSKTIIIKTYGRDRPESLEVIKEWRGVMDQYNKPEPKVILLEAYASLTYTMSENLMPFNFFLITNLNASSTAQDFQDVISMWLDNMPAGKWPNWVLDNHDQPRFTSRLGPGLVDAMNSLLLLLPGTAILYNGQELGMADIDVLWEDVQDPFGRNMGPALYKKYSRDPSRSPFQWDGSVSAGFSTNPKPWLPVNPNYYYLNLEAQKKAEVSHYNIVKRLIKLRQSKVFQLGKLKLHVLGKYVLGFTRSLPGEPTYLIIINLSSFQEEILLSKIIPEVSSLHVHTASVNSEYKIGHTVPTSLTFSMRPKSSLVLTTDKIKLSLPLSSHSSKTEL
ncbi:hypothetical protein M8J75_016335 [Diaphorina citri]|nr:hypothetical protein M8J75_016335 [Diaphorina citri]